MIAQSGIGCIGLIGVIVKSTHGRIIHFGLGASADEQGDIAQLVAQIGVRIS